MFLPYNRRSHNEINQRIVERLAIGGTLTTDCWRAYPSAAQAAGVAHFTVNHSKGFVDPETGRNTNAIEGFHGNIKTDARAQFSGRLPYLSCEGLTYYLDLLVLRANRNTQKGKFFTQFMKDLWAWTWHPFKQYNPVTPVFDEDDLEDDGDADNDDEPVDDENPDDAEWFQVAEDVDEEYL